MKARLPFILFLVVFFAVSIFLLVSYKSFGITWDEGDVYHRAQAYIGCMRHGSGCDYFTSHDMSKGAFYGHLYPSILYLLNKNMNFDVFHLYSGGVFLLFLVLMYCACAKILKDPWLGLIYVVCLIFCFPFSGHALTNPKDMPFAYVYMFFIFLLFVYYKSTKTSWMYSLILGIFWSLLINLRVAGVTVAPLWLLVLVLKKHQHDSKYSTLFFEGITTVIIMFSGLILAFPLLHQNIVGNFVALLNSSKNFNWDPWKRKDNLV
jgi:hypothetical protein